MIRIAILDLYEGQANEGMRCLRQIIKEWSQQQMLPVECVEFDVRQKTEVPDLSFDVYLSSGGPGSPLDSVGSAWETAYFQWLEAVTAWNNNPLNSNKKSVFLICHSFEIVCRYLKLAHITKRKSTSFGVFPVHLTGAGKEETVFEGLHDPFYVVDSRDWQVVQPNEEMLLKTGAEILCIEKERPHVPYERAIMSMRINPYMIGTQFHPEADAAGMSMLLQSEEKKKMVIANYGAAKWQSMIDGLTDPEKIGWTYKQVLPNFLNNALHFYTKAA